MRAAEAPQTSHQRIKQELLRRFGQMQLESQLPSDRALAAEFGVAFLTINRVMRELEAEGYVERRKRRGTFLAARERSIFKNPGEGRVAGGTVVFAYPNYFSYHYWRRLQCVERGVHAYGKALAEYRTGLGGTCEQLCAFVRGREDVSGLVLTPVPGSLTREGLRLLDGLGLPVVILEPNDAVTLSRNLYAVTPDWYKTGYLKASALLEAGHRRIAYIANEPDSPERPLVMKGVRKALRDYKQPARSIQIIEQSTRPWQDSRECSLQLAKEMIGAGMTGLIFDSFNGAKGALLAAWRLGVPVPQRLSVIAGGNSGGEEGYSIPPLTSVEYDIEREMALALEIVLRNGTQTSRTSLVDVQLHQRESVGSPAGSL